MERVPFRSGIEFYTMFTVLPIGHLPYGTFSEILREHLEFKYGRIAEPQYIDLVQKIPESSKPAILQEYALTGRIENITLSSNGSGYTEVPRVEIIGNCISRAKVRAIMSNDTVDSLEIIDPGYGYTTVPQVVFTTHSGNEIPAVATVDSLIDDIIEPDVYRYTFGVVKFSNPWTLDTLTEELTTFSYINTSRPKNGDYAIDIISSKLNGIAWYKNGLKQGDVYFTRKFPTTNIDKMGCYVLWNEGVLTPHLWYENQFVSFRNYEEKTGILTKCTPILSNTGIELHIGGLSISKYENNSYTSISITFGNEYTNGSLKCVADEDIKFYDGNGIVSVRDFPVVTEDLWFNTVNNTVLVEGFGQDLSSYTTLQQLTIDYSAQQIFMINEEYTNVTKVFLNGVLADFRFNTNSKVLEILEYVDVTDELVIEVLR